MTPPPVGGRAAYALRTINAHIAREKAYLLEEMLQVKGLVPLLMKPRNGERWTAEDKALLKDHLKRVSRLSHYLAVLLLPGGLLLLPALSWWLDRRRGKRLDL
ncbi:MAG: hypothetical protein V4637_14970 [Pseudomonadota bacterium]